MAGNHSWQQLLASDGQVLTRVDDVAPGDTVFLQADGRLVAFETTRVAIHDGRTLLFQSTSRWYQIGGGSRVRFEYALRAESSQE